MNKASDIQLSQQSFISLHVQLHNQLRQLILSGHWPSGSRIPSENELTTYLKISRSTVRLGLQRAEIEGLIERTAGRGTFVAYLPRREHEIKLIAFVTHGFDTETHLLMLKGAESKLKSDGYQVILSHIQNQDEEFAVLERLSSDYYSGVLLWPHANASRIEQENISKYRDVPVPMVLMDRQIAGLNCDCVTSDNYGGALALMRHLHELGHERIVFLTHHEMHLLTAQERFRGYCDAMHEAGLVATQPWVIGQPGSEISANDAFRSAMSISSPELQQIRQYWENADPRPTAIFALNDYLAVLALRAVKLLGLHVPDTVSITGFDDIDLAAQLEVPLTTVAQDMFEIGKEAAARLLQRLKGYDGPASCEIIPTELCIRSSTSVPVRV